MNVAWHDLIATDFGILSVITIVAVLGIGFFFGNFVRKHVREDEAKAVAAEKNKVAGR